MEKSPFDLYQEAMDAERAAWLALKGALPGSPNFDQSKWDAWQIALRRSDAARKAMVEEMGKPFVSSKPADLR